MQGFEEQVKEDLHRYLKMEGKVDEILPDAPDIKEKWESLAQAYMPDGIREFTGYPTVSLGWMMYVGMAVAKLWDQDWKKYSSVENLYTYLRDKRGYDTMDEYILEEVLCVEGKERKDIENIVAESASRTHSKLRHSTIEPGTKAAFFAYISCIHQLYLMGAAIQLKAMGYKMLKMS